MMMAVSVSAVLVSLALRLTMTADKSQQMSFGGIGLLMRSLARRPERLDKVERQVDRDQRV